MEFIAAAEVAVIGFFQALVLEVEQRLNSVFMAYTQWREHPNVLHSLDSEVPAVSLIHSVVQNFQDVSFGISTASEVLAHYNITGNTISLFRLVDNKQLDLKGEDFESMDATKLSRFIESNNLRLVTEYNAITAIGLFNSMIPIHLLLIMNKASSEFEENLHRFQEAAKLFQGRILFILVDSGVKQNEKAISFFKLKMAELPALAIYQTLDDKWDTLPITEVLVEQVQNFCDGFLKGKGLRQNHEAKEKTSKVEL
nr:PREDICTED: endoplasmic reticulum resident protein 27 isoform X2 [Bos mutus]